MVTLTIDKKTVTVPEGTTILEAARSANISIPTLCYLKGINEIAACRICILHENDGADLGNMVRLLLEDCGVAGISHSERGAVAYTVVDLEHRPIDQAIEGLRQLQGVLRLRCL